MEYSREDDGFERVATIDIETTHYDPEQGETVSIGIGVHDRESAGSEATYEMYHRDGETEGEMIKRAFRRLDEFGADGLVSYNGRGFDIDFLVERLSITGEDYHETSLHTEDTHIDLFEDRKTEASRRNQKWPSLEECVESYGWKPASTVWQGSEVTSKRFGRELGPAYLKAVDEGDDDRRATLTDVIEHYLVTDLEANFAVYYADIGEEFEPVHMGTTLNDDVAPRS
ncbi:ribonuclease H-like domain-containing protein [Haloprofundus halobius]|uniref:ribonuclease H-like domain-containing protein n=1 Tax=Haloprofundus halobius TaxID=2876194 RepID=UPI001CCB1229|nr:ribonuclease H-like domain-containing protein [Haloprofundus halobius]